MTAMITGCVRKMDVCLGDPVNYHLVLGEHRVLLNQYIGQRVSLQFKGVIHCVQCDRLIKKTFQQGLCYPCMQRINECGNCIIHPERCLVEQGGCSKDDWAHQQCYGEHFVYLANTSGLKVGITRAANIPSRWIDQGAMQAVPLFSTANRYQAGLVEVALKSYIADKTNWRKMLQQDSDLTDLKIFSKGLLHKASNDLSPILEKYTAAITVVDMAETQINFPVTAYPEKVRSFSFDKLDEVSAVLTGIKGQYLIFDSGVLNVRKFGGYELSFKIL